MTSYRKLEESLCPLKPKGEVSHGVELADIFRIHGPAYFAKYCESMLPSHRKAMYDIEHCRTDYFGGHLYYCEPCDESRYSYHSCKNRNCPKCGNDEANQWLHNQSELLLPVIHYLVTFTLPECFRKVARSNQKLIYGIFFRTSAAALQKLAWDPKFVGGLLGMMGVLQTWTRDMRYHLHIHYIVPGVGLSKDGEQLFAARDNFLVPEAALAKIFRGKFRDALKKTELYKEIPSEVWHQNWVVDSEPVGTGEHAFKYLAPYIFRVAISNNRILSLNDGIVTFKYQQSQTNQWKTQSLPAEKFIYRFLQHVLPHRFIKVRYYGLFCRTKRHLLEKAKELLGVPLTSRTEESQATQQAQLQVVADEVQPQPRALRCPKCGKEMIIIKDIKSKKWKPP